MLETRVVINPYEPSAPSKQKRGAKYLPVTPSRSACQAVRCVSPGSSRGCSPSGPSDYYALKCNLAFGESNAVGIRSHAIGELEQGIALGRI